MRQIRHIAGILAGMAILVGAPSFAQDADLSPEIAATTDQLIADALLDEVGLQFVEDLTTEVGARLGGSPDEARARVWAMNALKELNFDRTRVEDFTIPYWARTRESARVIGANAQDLVITALGGSRATPEGGLEADIVRFETLSDLKAADADSLAGKIAFIDERMYKTQDGSGYGLAVRKRGGCANAAAEKGAGAWAPAPFGPHEECVSGFHCCPRVRVMASVKAHPGP